MSEENITKEIQTGTIPYRPIKVESGIPNPGDFTPADVLYDTLVKDVLRYHPSDDLSMIEKAYKVAGL